LNAIRVGVGGWVYEPWNETFYPPGLPKARHLAHASRRLTSIEINATFYRTQAPATFAAWASQVPDDFVFAVKAPRAAAGRTNLAEAAPSIERFLANGLDRLGPKLGPILWQLTPQRRYERGALAPFLDLLPAELGGRPLRHVIEVRHESFADPAFADELRPRGVAAAMVDSEKHCFLDLATAPFAYLRLERSVDDEPAGYPPAALDAWAARLRALAARGPVFAYVISGAKHRAPAAAEALIARLGEAALRPAGLDAGP